MTIPTAELHVHLEGTITPALATHLAARNHITLPHHLVSPDGQRYVYQDFLDFLKTYDNVADVIKQPRDYYDITYDYLSRSAATGGIYVEMMYSPSHAESASGISSIEHLKAIQQAIDDAEKTYQIVGRILITAVRHLGAEVATQVIKEALKNPMPCVVGFGLGGDEFNYPPHLFKEAYAIAANNGLHCTVHAGEFAPASGMVEAMTELPITRIGHGVMAMHDPDVIQMLVDRNIALEICPSSNIALGLFPDFEAHPLRQFMHAGVRVSLGSDDPPFFGTTVREEYRRVQSHYDFSDDTMTTFTRMAIEDAFVDVETKKQLLARLTTNLDAIGV